MDRFIACVFIRSTSTKNYLKSNMDRFIENLTHNRQFFKMYLKSNMERFIVNRSFAMNRFIII